jgi:VanZ family protein
MRKTTAWPLALIYTALIAYASLYPFAGWRAQGLTPWLVFMESPPPPGPWSDIVINLVGYAPYGFLLCFAGLRTWPRWFTPIGATLLAGLVSLAMETLQIYLPTRVPSTWDVAVNLLGAGIGATLAWGGARLGGLTRWSHWRDRWFVMDAHHALALLALWPIALLFPVPVPFGLGQVVGAAMAYMQTQGGDVFVGLAGFMPQAQLSADGELLCVAFGLLAPCLLACSASPRWLHRVVLVLGVFALGVGVTVASSWVSYGPAHVGAWLTRPAAVGVVVALGLALALALLPQRVCGVLLALVLVVQLGVLNSSAPGPYLEQTLQRWEQGRWIHFYGLAQWLGWLWPYVALLYAVLGQQQPVAVRQAPKATPNTSQPQPRKRKTSV